MVRRKYKVAVTRRNGDVLATVLVAQPSKADAAEQAKKDLKQLGVPDAWAFDYHVEEW